MKLYLLAVALFLPSSAWADDFRGVRVEATGGFDRINFDKADPNAHLLLDVPSGRGDGVIGASLGYDLALGNGWVAGPYVGIDFGGRQDCSTLGTVGEFCLKGGRNVTAGIRAGVKLDEQVLLYGQAGYSKSKVSLSYKTPN